MIPLSLITGFLGSGKTTFLQRVVERSRDRRLFYLVNEFSTVDIDGQVLNLGPDQLVTVAGGSIFCRCLVTEFIARLRQILDNGGDTLDGVVIEASGIANPKVTQQMLAETQLDRQYDLRTIVTIIDPGSFDDLLEMLPNIAAQIEASDVAIVNKTDLFDEETLDATEARIRQLNATARILRAQHCDVDLDLFASSPGRDLHGEYAKCADPNYLTLAVRLEHEIDIERLSEALAEYADLLYRVKGYVRGDRTRVYIDVSRGQTTISEAPASNRPGELILIARGDARRRINPFIEALETGQFDC
ncbi:MAG: GTP-binding protein [Phycisphaerae bacterium]|nr:GTP-binding protein [Phycisphaerae bacterium]